MMKVLFGLLLPFAGTTLGAMMVFLMRSGLHRTVEKLLLGFASGVMIAASVWSLLLPSLELAKAQRGPVWMPAAVGFFLGVGFLLVVDRFVPAPERSAVLASRKTMLLVFAVTLHNIPEGMAVGVAFSGALLGNAGVTIAAAFALSVGIAIQNFPEGAIISMPLKSEGLSKGRAFLLGTLSGAVEPAAAVITLLLTAAIRAALPYLLAFAAGAMICVVVEDLIPDAQAGTHTRLATLGVTVGFLVMMILDVALG